MIEREDSLRQQIAQLVLGGEGFDVTLGTKAADKIIHLFKDSIVKAAYDAAAQHTPVMVGSGIVGCTGCGWNSMEYPPFAQHIRALPPESAILGAQEAELEARLEEARWWEHLVGWHNKGADCEKDCMYCARIAALESQLSALKAKREGGAKHEG